MSKKTRSKKMRLGRKIKQARRLPLLVSVRTHRRVQSNLFSRNWRRQKMHLSD
jgi:ribosomal protein L39E